MASLRHLRRKACQGKRQYKTEAEAKVKNIARFFETVKAYGDVAEHDRVPAFVAHLDLLPHGAPGKRSGNDGQRHSDVGDRGRLAHAEDVFDQHVYGDTSALPNPSYRLAPSCRLKPPFESVLPWG